MGGFCVRKLCSNRLRWLFSMIWLLKANIRIPGQESHSVSEAAFQELDDAQAYARFRAWQIASSYEQYRFLAIDDFLIRLENNTGGTINLVIAVASFNPIPEFD